MVDNGTGFASTESIMRQLVALVFATLVPLSISACAEEPPKEECGVTVVCECYGDLDVRIKRASFPQQLQVTWNGVVIEDPCQNIHSGVTLIERHPSEIVINDGGFGYRPRDSVSVTLSDLKDCGSTPEVVVKIENQPVPGAPFRNCSHAELIVEK